MLSTIEKGLSLAWRAVRRVTRGSRRPLPAARTWEDGYRSGKWGYLWSDDELPRYALLSAYLRQRCPDGSILDLGCGEGILCDRLWPGSFRQYLEVDISAEAVDRAKQLNQPRASYECADVEQYHTAEGQTFDAVVFNEVLYYFRDPVAVATRFAQDLSPQGILVASMYEPSMKTIRGAIATLDQTFSWAQQYSVSHMDSGKVWIIKVWANGDPRHTV